MAKVILTVGHSNHTIERFIELLRRHNVTAIADVRSAPFSRINPQFSRGPLATVLRKHHIAYSFLGAELGARPASATCYVGGRASYNLIARTESFHAGIGRVVGGSERYRIALVCAERDPMTCHRAILVSRYLIARGFSCEHILADGNIEAHQSAIRRIADEMGAPLHDLFRTQEELMNDIYERRAFDIEYVDRSAVSR